MKYYLKDHKGGYYVKELRGTYSIDDAKEFNSIEEIITTVPIMKDWNWDYNIYQLVDKKLIIFPDTKWIPMHRKWQKEHPDAYNILYNINKTISSQDY